MKKNLELHVIIAGICALLFLVLMTLAAAVDVQPIGPDETTVGLASLNACLQDALPYRAPVYWASALLTLAALLTPVYFSLMGLQQCRQQGTQQGTLDPDLYLLAGTYALTAAVWLFFRLCVLNYRPVLINNALRASFPAAPVLLSIPLLGTAASQFAQRMGNTKQGKQAVLVCYTLMAAIAVTSLLSGAYWLTDILGGLLLGIMLLQFYTAAIAVLEGQTLRHFFTDTPVRTPDAAVPKLKLISITPKKLPRIKLPKRYTPKH